MRIVKRDKQDLEVCTSKASVDCLNLHVLDSSVETACMHACI